MGRKEIMDSLDAPAHLFTTGANPVCRQAALAVLDTLEDENLLAEAEKKGQYVREKMAKWQEQFDFIGDVRGLGLSIGVVFIYVLLQEMFSTSCAFIWTVSDAVTTHRTPVRLQRIVIIANSIITFIVAQLPFRTLVNIVYPISGYIGLIFLVALIVKEIYLHFNRETAVS